MQKGRTEEALILHCHSTISDVNDTMSTCSISPHLINKRDARVFKLRMQLLLHLLSERRGRLLFQLANIGVLWWSYCWPLSHFNWWNENEFERGNSAKSGRHLLVTSKTRNLLQHVPKLTRKKLYFTHAGEIENVIRAKNAVIKFIRMPIKHIIYLVHNFHYT